MHIAYVDITNFRGLAKAHITFQGHSVLIGDNNAGKSTIFEALDLVLGPERLSRVPVIDEHDFFGGKYLDNESLVLIEIEVIIIDLSAEQKRKFGNNIEFWDVEKEELIGVGGIKEVDKPEIVEALRVKFVGNYDHEEDDFVGETFFCSPVIEGGTLPAFRKSDKRECGFLYLRALRTGSRALSLERGSLLDIILRVKEIRPKMWEAVLTQLRNTSIAENSPIGVHDILSKVQTTLKEFVPEDWGSEPHLRVSDLTREHLRKTLTVFMSSGKNSYYAPFHHQGTGTINVMVLALLSMIGEAKQSVIFAMEEPEIAIPPYTQKRIVNSLCKKSAQAIFTSHSPFVLEEFKPSQIILIQRDQEGIVTSKQVSFPNHIKAKTFSREFRLRFSEALLAKRVLITEGSTESSAYSSAARSLNDEEPLNYSSLEGLGIAIFDAESENNIPLFGDYFKNLGKQTFAVFDRQTDENRKKIGSAVHFPFESNYKGFEQLLLAEISENILKDFLQALIDENEWPSHLNHLKPATVNNIEEVKKALLEYLCWSKGAKGATDLLSCCKSSEMPKTLKICLSEITKLLKNAADEQIP